MTLTILELSLVVLVGASGSGKSTFARCHRTSCEVTFLKNERRALDSKESRLSRATKLGSMALPERTQRADLP